MSHTATLVPFVPASHGTGQAGHVGQMGQCRVIGRPGLYGVCVADGGGYEVQLADKQVEGTPVLLGEVRGDEPGGWTGEVGEAAGVCPALSRDMAAGRDGGVLLEGSGGGCRDGAAGGCVADAVLPPADEPVGDVDVGEPFFVGGVLFQDIGDGYGQSIYGGELFGPLPVAVGVGKGDDFAAPEDGEFFGRELGFASGGEPDVFGHDAGGDDGGLFGFDEGYGPASAAGFGEQVLAEEALGELPAGRELVGAFHQGVDPADAEGCAWVFDAFARGGVVFHDLAGADAACGVYLEVDDVAGAGDSEAVGVCEGGHGVLGEDGAQECGEGAGDVLADGAAEDVLRDGALRCVPVL